MALLSSSFVGNVLSSFLSPTDTANLSSSSRDIYKTYNTDCARDLNVKEDCWKTDVLDTACGDYCVNYVIDAINRLFEYAWNMRITHPINVQFVHDEWEIFGNGSVLFHNGVNAYRGADAREAWVQMATKIIDSFIKGFRERDNETIYVMIYYGDSGFSYEQFKNDPIRIATHTRDGRVRQGGGGTPYVTYTYHPDLLSWSIQSDHVRASLSSARQTRSKGPVNPLAVRTSTTKRRRVKPKPLVDVQGNPYEDYDEEEVKVAPEPPISLAQYHSDKYSRQTTAADIYGENLVNENLVRLPRLADNEEMQAAMDEAAEVRRQFEEYIRARDEEIAAQNGMNEFQLIQQAMENGEDNDMEHIYDNEELD